MSQATEQNFGTLIAYIIPGWIALFGLSAVLPDVPVWLIDQNDGNTVGGFLYSTATAITIGLILNAIRMAIVDVVLSFSSPGSKRDYERLQHNIGAVDFLVHNQFRYHQFYGNGALAMVIVAATSAASDGNFHMAITSGILAIMSFLVYGSIKCLRVYYSRLHEILTETDQKKSR